MCGSPEYMAPETISGTGYGKSVDWWALGTLFYEMVIGLPPFYSEDPHEMTKLILSAPLKFPPGISKNATSLISMLLNRDPSRRLGSGESDVEEIKSHPFFRSINWTKVLNKEIDPPFKPHLNGPLDLSYFDPLCTIHSLPINPNSYNNNLSETDQMAFQGFSYSAPEFFNLTSSISGGGNNSGVVGATPNSAVSSPSLMRSNQNTPPNVLRSNNNSPMTIVQSTPPIYSFTSISQQHHQQQQQQFNNSPSSAQSTPSSPPPPNPTIKQNGSWVQPQYPHLHQPPPTEATLYQTPRT
ncbi:putative protein serine/threonine kinase [Heterostelium album PN500]|uniref:Uncharacterized protein n=1 Tax=Heterostelium pallidum (strain ATCC 26659 / Pp 5 / PN500) TaxID=670386 RepID=D3BFC5_HETP5|nr:putative protein serine/threonine kinase [Heterostelium album PN500]EFA79839.1 putative protein serine/threonine kinase [Heterostelium album PN500]|eukprot:XP_020431960.1 putative protein serine/threonine kinase [Heterostelium album PN500]